MEENKIFGSNVVLPTLPGLQSDCEEEILLLMKEVDSVFEQKHGELLNELKSVHSQCRTQREEIENLRGLLMPSCLDFQNNKVDESSKDFYSEIQKLKKESNELKTENFSLQRQLQRLPESEIQLNSLKRSLTLQQDENRALKERLLKVNQEYETLRNSYQRLVNTLAAHRQGNIKSTSNNVVEPSPPDLVKAQIAQTAEKIISEETKYCNDFHFKINQEIDDLERRLQKEII